MSALNGDRARYRINQVRKLHRRQRLQALVAGLKIRVANKVRTTAVAPSDGASGAAALAMQSEGGPTRSGD